MLASYACITNDDHGQHRQKSLLQCLQAMLAYNACIPNNDHGQHRQKSLHTMLAYNACYSQSSSGMTHAITAYKHSLHIMLAIQHEYNNIQDMLALIFTINSNVLI
jgi:hypothetical protein